MSTLSENKPVRRGRPVDTEARSVRRKEIVEAARRCFLRKGFHAASTAEISAEAEISVAGLYQYFPTKADLVLALAQEDLDADLADVASLRNAATLQDGITKLMLGYAKDASSATATRLRLEVYAEASRDPKVQAIVIENEVKLIEAVTRLLEKFQATEEIDANLDARSGATVLLSFIDGVFTRLSLPHQDAEKFVNDAATLLARALAKS
jgi:AcrR family transcriptional regulator